MFEEAVTAANVEVVTTPLSVEGGELTPTLKLKRRVVRNIVRGLNRRDVRLGHWQA